MKKPKLSKSVDSGIAGRNELYQTAIDLDQSSDDPSSLIDAVYDLVGISYEDIGSYKDQKKHSTADASPKSGWALRWILKRLSEQDPSKNKIRTEPRVWRMVRYLVLILPFQSCTSLLVEYKFADVVHDTLLALTLITAENPSERSARDQDGETMSSFVEAQEQIYAQQNLQKSKKRKLDVSHAPSTWSNVLLVYGELLEVLRILETTRAPNQTIHLDRPLRLEAIFRVEIDQAARILGNALSIVDMIFQTASSSIKPRARELDVELIEPLIVMWQVVTATKISSDASTVCLQFAKHCFEPCVRLLQSSRTFDCDSEPGKSLQNQLQQMLTRSFVLPFRTISMDTRKLSKETVEEAEANLKMLKSELRVDGVDRTRVYSMLPRVFELASDCCDRSTVSRRYHEDGWLEALLKFLYDITDINSETNISERSGRDTASKHRMLAQLLQATARIHLKVDKKFVEDILLQYQRFIQKSKYFSEQLAMWDVIGACMEADYTTVVPRRDEKHSEVARKLLDSLELSLSDPIDVFPPQGGLHVVYHYALEKFFVSFVGAYRRERLIPELLAIWRDRIQSSLDKIVLEAETSQQFFVLPWLDGRILHLISRSVMELSPTQQIKQLQVFCEDLQTSRTGDVKFSALVVISCFPLKTDSFRPEPTFVQVIKELSGRLASILLSPKGEANTFPRSQFWRVWALLTVCISEMDESDLLEASKLKELLDEGKSLVTKSLKDSSKSQVGPHFESVFALRFILAVGRCGTASSSGLTSKASRTIEKIVERFTSRLKQTGEDGYEFDAPSVLVNQSCVQANSAGAQTICLLLCLILQNDKGLGKHDTLLLDTFHALLDKACLEDEIYTETSTEFCYQDTWNMMMDGPNSQNYVMLMAVISKLLVKCIAEPDQPEFFRLKDSAFFARVLHFRYESLLNNGQAEEATRMLEEWTDICGNDIPNDRHRKQQALKETAQKVSKSGTLIRQSPTNHDLAGGQSNEQVTVSAVEHALYNMASSIDAVHLSRLETDPTQRDLPKKFILLKGERTEERQEALCRISLKMIGLLEKALNACQFVQLTRNMERMMTKQAWSIAQYHIDSLLAVIEHHTSNQSQLASDGSAEAVYRCLCRIFACVLTNHRAKMGGRYHLVVPALNGLLRCLFENNSASSSRRWIERPNWLAGAEESLKARNASDLSRLLSSICDPTWSAARISAGGKGGQLNDPTKKARSLAGQSMLFVVIEFCKCQLRGHLDPLVREQLLPGIYSILDAMTKDVMQHMNSVMDASQRAIFKTLYDDWSRFGTWKKT